MGTKKRAKNYIVVIGNNKVKIELKISDEGNEEENSYIASYFSGEESNILGSDYIHKCAPEFSEYYEYLRYIGRGASKISDVQKSIVEHLHKKPE